LLLDSTIVPSVAEIVDPEHFYKQSHATIYQAILALYTGSGMPADAVTLARELKQRGQFEAVGGAAEIAELTGAVPTSANAVYYAQIVLDRARRREGIRVLAEAQREMYESRDTTADVFTRTERAVTSFTSLNGRSRGAEPILVRFSDVPDQVVQWLWEPYIPAGMLTILEGDPSAGKTWLAMAIIAALTRGSGFICADRVVGRPAPPPASAIYMSCEDSIAYTLGPRLKSMGGDPARVIGLKAADVVIQGKHIPRTVTLSDVGVIEKAIIAEKPALVVVDPLQSFLGADVDMHRANEVRPVLDGLGALAEKHRCAVLCIRHLAKARASKAIYGGMGSIDFTGAVRSVLLAGRSPAPSKARAFVQIKNNLAKEGPAIGYELGEQGFLWTGLSNLTAADLNAPEEAVTPTTKSDEAAEWLREFLANGWTPTVQILAAGARHSPPFSQRTLERAKALAGVVSEKHGAAGGWRLSP
jgi:hypothetical protein